MGAVLVLSVITPNGQRRIAGVVAGESGRYADLIRRSFAYDGIQIHHMPQAAMNFTSRADGGAIALTDLEHSFTRTFAGRGRVVANQERGMPFRTILARDIRDVRRITGSKYNQGLLELLDYYRANHSSLMLK